MSVERQPLTLVHTSDLHLGSDLYPEDAMRGFRATLAFARQRGDVLLIAGDLLDSERVSSSMVDGVLEDLAGLGMPVVLLPGNHDVALVNGRTPGRLPTNVHLILREVGASVDLSEQGLTVWGRPVLDHAPQFRPLEGLPARPASSWYVVMAHGMVNPQGLRLFPSSPITAEELSAADCDYIALGHVHVFRDVTQGKVPAFYSGAPGGMPGRGTVALVALEPQRGATVVPVHLDQVL
ncbi:MAG: DNA repair exonuclease [Chloroflexi bacterium]|nr:DNA repair exonuclease [Chloroflexota bacterium]